MSLVDKLMAVDSGAFADDATAEIKSRHLSAIIGEDAIVKVRGLSSDAYMDIAAKLYDKKGNIDFSKSYDSAALLVVEGVFEPDLKDSKLQKHFNAATPKELAKILFKGNELTDIASKVTELSGFGGNSAEEEDEVKN